MNGKVVPVEPVKGYASVKRQWKKGDVIELTLPIEPRLVAVNDAVQTIKGKLAIASGPIVYGFEAIDNPDLKNYSIKNNDTMTLDYKSDLLNGVNVITGKATNSAGESVKFTAVPFYALGNRASGAPYQVWMPEKAN